MYIKRRHITFHFRLYYNFFSTRIKQYRKKNVRLRRLKQTLQETKKFTLREMSCWSAPLRQCLIIIICSNIFFICKLVSSCRKWFFHICGFLHRPHPMVKKIIAVQVYSIFSTNNMCCVQWIFLLNFFLFCF